VRDAQGFFISSLQPENVKIVEDSQQLMAAEMVELRPGAQIVVAVGVGDSFGIRDSQGNTRFDFIRAAMLAWAGVMAEDDIDDLSIVAPEGTLATHQENPNDWALAWQDYQPALEGATSSPDVLSIALDVVSDPIPNPGMGRAVLFLTPALPVSEAGLLQSLADRAIQSNVRVYVGMVDSPSLFEGPEAQQLQALATQTGGRFFAFSGSEPLPDFQNLLESARRIYRVGYNSRIAAGGMHEFGVIVQAPQGEIRTEVKSFSLELKAPNPIFVTPPNQIVRYIPEDAAVEIENLVPREYNLEIVIEFPDTIQREIVQTILYANNEFLTENNQPPFDQFTVDLTQFEASELIMFRVEAVDELGMVGTSIDTPVQITIQQPDRSFIAVLARNAPMLAIGITVFAGVVLLLVLVLAGRLRPRRIGERRRRRAAKLDPVTQPLSLIEEHQPDEEKQGSLLRFASRLPTSRLRWPQRRGKADVFAYLVKIDEEGEPEPGNIFSIITPETTFGSDPEQATVKLDSPAVESLHARLWRNEEGDFIIADKDSVAGTWINYAPVSMDGCRVEHGDLIHIAKTGFRFTLTNPTRPRRPVVTPLEDES
jgi:hypothetical protein